MTFGEVEKGLRANHAGHQGDDLSSEGCQFDSHSGGQTPNVNRT